MAIVRNVNQTIDNGLYWLQQYNTFLLNLGYVGTDDSLSYVTTVASASKLVKTLPGGKIDVSLIPTSTSSGLIDGTVGAPSLYFINETGLGLYRPSAGKLGFTVAGLETLTLEKSGTIFNAKLGSDAYSQNSVLVGDLSPGPTPNSGAQLVVAGSGSSTGQVNVSAYSGLAQLTVTRSTPGESSVYASSYAGTTSNTDFLLKANNVTCLTLDASDGYTYGSTPPPGDSSTKLATTAFVQTSTYTHPFYTMTISTDANITTPAAFTTNIVQTNITISTQGGLQFGAGSRDIPGSSQLFQMYVNNPTASPIVINQYLLAIDDNFRGFMNGVSVPSATRIGDAHDIDISWTFPPGDNLVQIILNNSGGGDSYVILFGEFFAGTALTFAPKYYP